MTTGLWTHEAFSNHVNPPGHPEQVARLAYVERALSDARFAGLQWFAAPLAEDAPILRCHPQSHIDRIVAAEPRICRPARSRRRAVLLVLRSRLWMLSCQAI